MLKLQGPWLVEKLKTYARAPWQDDRIGAYVVGIKQSKYNPNHGPSRFIYIGAMGSSENAALRKRVGEFIIDAFGFLSHHSAGTRFYEECTSIPLLAKANDESDISEIIKRDALSPWDLEFWWYETEDPLCCESLLMRAYEEDFKRLPLLNKNFNRNGCGCHQRELMSGTYEQGTLYPWKK